MTFLRDLANYKTLVDCTLQSSDLSAVLTGLCDVVIQQQTELAELKSALIRNPPGSSDSSDTNDPSADCVHLKTEMQTELDRMRRECSDIRRSVSVVSTSTELHFQTIENEMTKQFRATGIRLEESDLDIRTQIQDLNLVNTKVLAELKAVREAVGKFDVVAATAIIERVRNVELDLAKMNCAFDKSRNEFRQEIGTRVNAEASLKRQLDNRFAELDKRVRFCEDHALGIPELEATVLNGGELTVNLILRTVMRDSRRIDHFDEHVSAIRMECENIGSSVVKVHEVLQQFNHTIYDYGLELQKNSSYVDTTFRSVKSVMTTIGTLTSNIFTNLTQLTDVDAHLASSCSSAFDEVVRLMCLMSGRTFHNVHELDAVELEATEVRQNLHTQRYDLDMSKVLRKLDFPDIDLSPAPQSAKLPEFAKTINITPMAKDSADISRDPFVLLSLEEMRVKMDKYEATISQFVHDVSSDIADMKSHLREKMDVDNVDRLVAKLEFILTKLKEERRVPQVLSIPFSCSTLCSSDKSRDLPDVIVSSAHSPTDVQTAMPSSRKGPVPKSPHQPQIADPMTLKALRVQADYSHKSSPKVQRRVRPAVPKAQTQVLASSLV
jgi:hypothetical protein